MNNWDKLKNYINNAANTKPHENGHGKVSAFCEIKKLMELIENNEDEGIIIDNNTFKFEHTNASIVFGKNFKEDE